MSVTVKVIVVLVIAAVLGGGGYAVFHKKGSNAASPSSNTSPASTNANTTTNTSQPDNTPVAATITFSDNGFSPALVTIKSGEIIRITNNSNQPIQFDSDPHPAHTDNTELNVGEVDTGQSKTFVLTAKGSWGYHDHLSPDFTGRINVE